MVGVIDEIGLSCPEVTQIDTKTITGISYNTLIRTGVPKVGFRKPNAPANYVASKHELRNINLFSISTMVHVDSLILQASEAGEAEELAKEAASVTQGAMLSMGAQCFYGTRIDKDGFPGLHNYIDDSMVMSAEPDNAKTEKGTSVYAIVEGVRGVQWVYGKGQPFNLGAFRDRDRIENSKVIPGKGADLNAWLAIVNHSKLTAARLQNVGSSESSGLTDDLIAELLMRFPAGMKPTKLIMNRKALSQLRKSRNVVGVSSATNGGSFTSAPVPTEAHGVPILVTDSILDDESDLSSITGASYWGEKKSK